MIEASRKGHLSCVMALLKNEDVTITEGSLCTSLSAAAEKGFAEVVRALLQVQESFLFCSL